MAEYLKTQNNEILFTSSYCSVAWEGGNLAGLAWQVSKVSELLIKCSKSLLQSLMVNPVYDLTMTLPWTNFTNCT